MADADAVAKRLARSFRANGNFVLAGDRTSSPASTVDGDEDLDELEEFAGLQVHSVGSDPGDPDEGREPTVFIYVVRGSKRTLQALPQERDGVHVVVKPMGVMNVRPQASAKQAPNMFKKDGRIACGSSCAPTGVSYSGTMGALLEADDKLYCLSNNHILGDCNHIPKGTPVLSPSNKDGRANLPDPTTIARVSVVIPMNSGNPEHVLPATLDVALAELTNKTKVTSWQGNADDGYDTPATVATPFAGMQVKKMGRTTGLTMGVIESLVSDPMAVPYVSEHFKAIVWMRNVWTVSGTQQHFALSGDSGSLVVTEDGSDAVGLLFAANPLGTYGWFVALEDVLAHKKLKGFSLVHGH